MQRMTRASDGPAWHGTTILSLRKGGIVVVAGDGQVSMGDTVVKSNARKVRRLAGGSVIAGFAGTTADATSNPAHSKIVRGALAVVEQALTFTKMAPYTQPALINGTPGIITVVNGRLMGVMHLTITAGKITEINILADHTRLAALPT